MVFDILGGILFSGVGCCILVFFKKVKNGVKLQRSLDRVLENGEDYGVVGFFVFLVSIEDECYFWKWLRSGSCSESEGERFFQQEEEIGMINGFGKYIESGFDLECSLGFSGGLVFEVCSGLMFFKCSCGKLVLF